MKKIFISVLFVLSLTSQAFAAITTDFLFDLPFSEHTGLAYDDDHLYAYAQQPDNVRKLTLVGDVVYDFVWGAGTMRGFEFINNELYGVGGLAARDYKIFLFNEADGSIVSSFRGRLGDVGIAQVGNEIYVLNVEGGIAPNRYYDLHIYDRGFNFVRSIRTNLLSEGTTSGFTAIGTDLFISINDSTYLWKLDATTGLIADSYFLPFATGIQNRGAAGLANDGSNIYMATTSHGMWKIGFNGSGQNTNAIPEPSTLILLGTGLLGLLFVRWKR
ncbi:PEP-CTERM sorting domain-containing protein [Omnitrophica bacterium]|nr:PEP-CTERM sorting domain-containing protein [Candidatus Omnitrophota bacterium]